MKTQVIIAAAGEGVRLESRTPKSLVFLGNKPLITYSLKAFEQCPSVYGIIVVTQRDTVEHIKDIIRELRLKKAVGVIEGGATRRESVKNGLAALDTDTDFVAIHDAARPCITPEVIERVLSVAYKDMAAIVAVAAKSTIKTADASKTIVEKTLKRDRLFEVQTPQVFKKDIILRAHKEVKDKNPTDDAVLVEKLGVPVKIVQGDYENIKITTKEDLALAEALLAR